MKKKLLILLPLLALALGGCSRNTTNPSNPDGQSSESIFDDAAEKKIKEIYDAYVSNGGTLSYEEWLESIKGEKGEKGDAGVSLLSGVGAPMSSLGNVGDSYIDTSTWDFYTKTTAGWTVIGNIKGDVGTPGNNGNDGQDGEDGQNGQDGEDGLSAYEIYVKYHPEYTGTEAEWIESLKGNDGNPGDNGENGLSAYEFYVQYHPDYTGTEEEWIESLKGDAGNNGLSAYEIAVQHGFEGSEEEWLESLKAPEPEKYIVGIAIEGNKIIVYYSDNTFEELIIEVSPSGGGEGQEIPENPTIVSLELEDKVSEYQVDDEFVKPTVFALYSDNSRVDVTTSATCSGYDMSIAGNYDVVVTYEEITTSYSIHISEKPAEQDYEIVLFFYLDYNDVEDSYFSTTILKGQTYSLSDLGLSNPASNPVYPNATFLGWSYLPTIFNQNQLIDMNNFKIDYNVAHVTIYGIWNIN